MVTQSLVTNDAVEFWPPAVPARPYGLFSAVNWWPEVNHETGAPDLPEMPNDLVSPRPGFTDPELAALAAGKGWYDGGDEPGRFLTAGVRFRTFNYGESSSSGVWNESWCVWPPSASAITGTRPSFPSHYLPVTAYAFDECDLSEYSHAEIKMHALQWLRLTAAISVETALATRMMSDVVSLSSVPSGANFTDMLGDVEGAIAATGTVGVIHASASLAAEAVLGNNVIEKNGVLETRLGNRWVFGGGYVSPMSTMMIATSPIYGWHTEPALRTTVEAQYNQFVAMAQQSFLVGYESLIGAAVYT